MHVVHVGLAVTSQVSAVSSFGGPGQGDKVDTGGPVEQCVCCAACSPDCGLPCVVVAAEVVVVLLLLWEEVEQPHALNHLFVIASL